jgi:hypothetical protein
MLNSHLVFFIQTELCFIPNYISLWMPEECFTYDPPSFGELV